MTFPSPIAADYYFSHDLPQPITSLLRANSLHKFVPLIAAQDAGGATWSSVVGAYLNGDNKTAADGHFTNVYDGFTRQPFWVSSRCFSLTIFNLVISNQFGHPNPWLPIA